MFLGLGVLAIGVLCLERREQLALPRHANAALSASLMVEEPYVEEALQLLKGLNGVTPIEGD